MFSLVIKLKFFLFFFLAKTCPIVPIFIKVKSWQLGKVRLILVLCGNTAGHILGSENIIS